MAMSWLVTTWASGTLGHPLCLPLQSLSGSELSNLWRRGWEVAPHRRLRTALEFVYTEVQPNQPGWVFPRTSVSPGLLETITALMTHQSELGYSGGMYI